ncbi:hypothetical protein KA005_26350 [bacterium]|nr:hypothetical protein [bacterium]
MNDFEKGVLFAVCIMMYGRTDATIAGDVLVNAGLTKIDVSELEDMDKRTLAKCNTDSRISLRGL